MDDLRKKTDKELEKIEKKLTKIYKDAEKEISEEWNKYMEQAFSLLAPLEKAYADAKASGDKDLIRKTGFELGKAKKLQTVQNDRFKAMTEETTARLTNVNQVALDYVNGNMPKIYTMNYNETLNEIETDIGKIGLSRSFSLMDENTANNLVKSDTSLFPQKVIDKAKDEKWNLKAINSQVLQGLLQGESIDKISRRLQNVTDMNSAAATRNARTMCTTAENNGRMSGMKEAEAKGIVYEKQWMATHDDRTRESHAELDGVSVGVDEEFPNGLMYPGDPAGEPEEVYNCFVGETKIGANSRVIRTYKHKYEGDLFTIKTASGIQFTCTPNHPILTSRGWIAANRINDGDDLFVTSVSKKPFFVTWSNPNINHVLARFNTLHKFFNVLGSKRTTDLGVNFHGDIPTSDVEIITKKRFLRVSRNAHRFKGIYKFLFVLADSFASALRFVLKILGRITAELACLMCGLCKSDPFRGWRLRHPQIHSLRPIALLDSGRIQKSYNNGARYAQLLSNSLNGFSGIVFADKVISIDIKFSHCDVFNLQSENGYYFASSIIPQRHKKYNNDIMIIAHNCRCSMVRKLIGFRREDGSVSEVGDIDSYEPHYFDKPQEEQAKESEKEQEPEIIEARSPEPQIEDEIPEAVLKEYSRFANKYATSKTEHTMTVDKNGKVLYEGGGKKTSVSTPREIALQSEGCHQIHNHTEDVVFSPGDIKYIEEWGLASMEVPTTGENVYTLVNGNPKRQENYPFYAAAQEAFETIEENVIEERRAYIAELQKTGMPKEETRRMLSEWNEENSTNARMIQWYEANSEEYGFTFFKGRLKEQEEEVRQEPRLQQPEPKQEEKKVSEDIDVKSLSMDVKFDYLYTKEQGYTQSELKEEYSKYKDVMYNMTPDQRYDLAKEMTKEIPTENNFFKNSVGFWKKAEERTEEPNHISYNKRNGNISSEYWYSKEGVYRRSDHWGSDVASCSWYIEGREYSNYGVELGERETAFIPWSDLKAKGVIHYDEGVYTLNEYEHNFTFS